MFEEEIRLFIEGKEDAAAKGIFQKAEKIAIYSLSKMGWKKREAISILGEAIIIIFNKLRNNEIPDFNLKYLLTTCRYIGANWKRNLNKNSFFLREQEWFEREYSYSFEEENIRYNDDESNLENELVLQALGELDERCQQIIYLKFFERISHKEILDEIPSLSSENHSKTALYRCMQKLHKILRKNGINSRKKK